MTEQQHPITPPSELVRGWLNEFHAPCLPQVLEAGETALHIATQAARWGADQELDACCEFMGLFAGVELRATRRPKPPSLKEEALLALSHLDKGAQPQMDTTEAADTIRRALGQLDD